MWTMIFIAGMINIIGGKVKLVFNVMFLILCVGWICCYSLHCLDRGSWMIMPTIFSCFIFMIFLIIFLLESIK